MDMNLAIKWAAQIVILMVLSGLSTELIDVPIPLSYEALIVLRRVHFVYHGRIIHRDAHDLPLMLMQDRSCALARSRGVVQQRAE